MSRSKNKSENKKFTAWFNAKDCSCKIDDCELMHKECYLCKKPMHKEVFIYELSELPHSLAWNKDHIKAKFLGGTDADENMIATHPWCNNDKSNSTIK
ncbi:HNH endonuclease [Spiroplasma endosymbiont of Othius punctulatus]|uniref:HNH endonuclease n=1 Tax=Spiroplasma endosymbiont of Othius punctulatus TaxID=3066289 RepID=UPI0030CC184F